MPDAVAGSQIPSSGAVYGPYETGQATNLRRVIVDKLGASVNAGGQLVDRQAWLREGNKIVGPYTIGQKTNIAGVTISNITGTVGQSGGAYQATNLRLWLDEGITAAFTNTLFVGQSERCEGFTVKLEGLGMQDEKGMSNALIEVKRSGSRFSQSGEIAPGAFHTFNFVGPRKEHQQSFTVYVAEAINSLHPLEKWATVITFPSSNATAQKVRVGGSASCNSGVSVELNSVTPRPWGQSTASVSVYDNGRPFDSATMPQDSLQVFAFNGRVFEVYVGKLSEDRSGQGQAQMLLFC